MLSVYVLSALLVGTLSSVGALQCNEGFNASISGIPLYHWVENTCSKRSKCFEQEISVSSEKFDATVRYGGCVSSAYAPYLTCESLFGPKSKLDPAILMNLIPDLDQKFQLVATSFMTDAVNQFHTLLSSGKGSGEFIDGLIKFAENLGFNMQKVKLLRNELTKTFELLFLGPNPHAVYQVQVSLANLLHALENLDTDDKEVAKNIYKFVENIREPYEIEELKDSEVYSTLIEKLPGLIKSTLPEDWRARLWFNPLFEMLGEIKFDDPKQSTADIIRTIRSTYLPYTYFYGGALESVLGPIYDSLPELVNQLVQKNATYVSYWSVQLLKSYSQTNGATDKLDAAFKRFLYGLGLETIPEDMETLIKFLPGLFYRIFPARKVDIEEAYNAMADGFNSFKFNDWTSTAEESELSRFVLMMIHKIGNTSVDQKVKTYIINFSRMFYNLLSEYDTQLDKFFVTLTDGFTNYPKFDTGNIIASLITNFNGTVPTELKPFLLNMQGVVDSFMAQPVDGDEVLDAVTKMINAYKLTYPESEFPVLAQRYVNLITAQLDGTMDAIQLQMAQNDLSVDLSFALFDAMGFNEDDMQEAFMEAFPVYGPYIKMMSRLDRSTVKELTRNFLKWLVEGFVSGGRPTSQSFVEMLQPTVKKITAEIGDVTSDLRAIFSPDSCSYDACDKDLCNGPKIERTGAWFLPPILDSINDRLKNTYQ